LHISIIIHQIFVNNHYEINDKHTKKIKTNIDGTKTVIEMAADGNCLFRALSDQLFYDYGNQHTDVREDIVEYMEDNKDDFVVFLVLNDKDSVEEDAEDFEGYCSEMRNDGTWGGNLELVAASKVYRYVLLILHQCLLTVVIDSDIEPYLYLFILILSMNYIQHR
jgi:OTU-like cysteine protease